MCDVLFYRLNFLAYKSFRRALNISSLKYVSFSPLPWHGMALHCLMLFTFFVTVLYSFQTILFFSTFPGVFFSTVKWIFVMIFSIFNYFSGLFSIRFWFHPCLSKYKTNKSIIPTIFVFHVTVDLLFKNTFDIGKGGWAKKNRSLFTCLLRVKLIVFFIILFGRSNFFNWALSLLLQVSWIRKRDLHILTVGILTYSSDQRFQAMHQEGSDEWTLKITSPQPRDSGIYFSFYFPNSSKFSFLFGLSLLFL